MPQGSLRLAAAAWLALGACGMVAAAWWRSSLLRTLIFLMGTQGGTLATTTTTTTRLRRGNASAVGVPGLVVVHVFGSARPGLVIGGIDKGGTTDAWEALRAETSNVSFGPHKELGCLLQAGRARSCYASKYGSAARDYFSVDATPSYLWGWTHAVDAAEVLHSVSPRSAVVFLLREPASRIVSLYNHWTLRILETTGHQTYERHHFGRSLDQTIALELDFLVHSAQGRRLTQKLLEYGGGGTIFHAYRGALYGLRHWLALAPEARCANVTGRANRAVAGASTCPVRCSFVLTSLYAAFLAHWNTHFAGRLLVVQSEAYFADRNVLFRHLRLPGPRPSLAGANLSRHPVANRGVYRAPMVPPTTRTRSEHDGRHRRLSESPAHDGDDRDDDYSYSLSPRVARRLADFLARPNTILRQLLSTQADLGNFVVSPPIAPDSLATWAWLPLAE